jgi:hypothetical protein
MKESDPWGLFTGSYDDTMAIIPSNRRSQRQHAAEMSQLYDLRTAFVLVSFVVRLGSASRYPVVLVGYVHGIMDAGASGQLEVSRVGFKARVRMVCAKMMELGVCSCTWSVALFI